MKSCSGIYTITAPSGKFYVGSAVSIEKRWITHRSQLGRGTHHNKRLQRAADKYGQDALQFSILLRCKKDQLIEMEQLCIDALNPDYNICRVAGSTLGLKMGPLSDERRAFLSELHTGRKATFETRVKLVRAAKNRKLPVDFAANASIRYSGEGNPFFGKKHSAEVLAKMSGDKHHSSRAVICVETGERHPSITAARDWLRSTINPSASASPIMSCCKGSTRYSKAYGYTWRYERNWRKGVMKKEDQLSLF